MAPCRHLRLGRLVLLALACAISVLVAATAVWGAAPRSSALPGSKLSVRALRVVPSSVEPGDSFAVAGKLRNRGRRARRALLQISLAAGQQPPTAAGSKRVRIAAQSRRLFTIEARVPAGLPAGDYRVTACVSPLKQGTIQRCRTARRRLSVADAPGPPVLADADGDGLPDVYDLCPTLAGPSALGGCPVPPPDRDGDGIPDDDDACPDDPGPALYDGCPDPPPPPPEYVSGARTLGDPLFPEVGNGGYDAGHYKVELNWTDAGNAFLAGTKTTITATAIQNLSDFSLDLEGLTVGSVTVDGAPASFSRVAPAACSAQTPPGPCGATKLVITPATPIDDGDVFTVAVAYTGVPQRHTDPDGSDEGWTDTADGAFVVNEPIGAMTWHPSNNYPLDKASYEYHLTVPTGKTALGNGEETAPPTDNGDGTTTWHWAEDDPTATYLTTSTVGDFDLTRSTTSFGLPLYDAIHSAFTPAEKLLASTSTNRQGAIVNYFAAAYGPYPFDSGGSVVDDADVGYALEVQTKSHFPSAAVDVATLAHEVAHQWYGDSVTLGAWKDIWLNEGWAVWSEWIWDYEENNGLRSPAQQFDTNYTPGIGGCPDNKWCRPPADPTAEEMFATFPTYTRAAMTLEALRQIVGNTRFFAIARRWHEDHAYGNANTAQFIALAKEESGLSGADLAKLDAFFQQWLFGSTMPTITGANFYD